MLDLDNLTGEKGTVNSLKDRPLFFGEEVKGGGGGENNGPT